MTRRRPGSVLVRLVLACGLLLPWAIGIVVKVSLDLEGKPTWDWLYFLHPGRMLLEVWATFWLALPSILLGALAHLAFTGRLPWVNAFTDREKQLIVVTCGLWGAVGSVPVLYSMFREFHPVSFLAPFFYTILYLDDYLLGLAAGVLLALSSLGIRRLRDRG